MNDAFGHPRTAILFGGTSDIGLAILERVIPLGCTSLVLAGRDAEALTGAAETLRATGASTVSTIVFDAASTTDIEGTVAACFDAIDGDVDLLIMAVGVLGDQARDEVDADATATVLTTSTVWPAAALAASFDKMKQRRHGGIVVLSSVAGVRVRRANYVYGAAKAGLDAYALGLSEAARGTGVSVHVVRPGFVRTKMTDGRPEAPFATDKGVVADAVVQGITQGKNIIWAPPPIRVMGNVARFVPQFLWRRLPG